MTACTSAGVSPSGGCQRRPREGVPDLTERAPADEPDRSRVLRTARPLLASGAAASLMGPSSAPDLTEDAFGQVRAGPGAAGSTGPGGAHGRQDAAAADR